MGGQTLDPDRSDSRLSFVADVGSRERVLGAILVRFSNFRGRPRGLAVKSGPGGEAQDTTNQQDT